MWITKANKMLQKERKQTLLPSLSQEYRCKNTTHINKLNPETDKMITHHEILGFIKVMQDNFNI